MVAFVASQQPSILVLPDFIAYADRRDPPETALDPSHEPSIEPTPARIVSAGSLIDGRSQPAATILTDGRVWSPAAIEPVGPA